MCTIISESARIFILEDGRRYYKELIIMIVDLYGVFKWQSIQRDYKRRLKVGQLGLVDPATIVY
jgi:hypothetical protein